MQVDQLLGYGGMDGLWSCSVELHGAVAPDDTAELLQTNRVARAGAARERLSGKDPVRLQAAAWLVRSLRAVWAHRTGRVAVDSEAAWRFLPLMAKTSISKDE